MVVVVDVGDLKSRRSTFGDVLCLLGQPRRRHGNRTLVTCESNLVQYNSHHSSLQLFYKDMSRLCFAAIV